jgi:hypothetical protein
MSKDTHPHRLVISEEGKKQAEQAAALLRLDSWPEALSLGADLVVEHAEASVDGGRTQIIYCTPHVHNLVESNPDFIEALCEEGVVEWLTALVLTKTHNNKPNANP